jgi:hypothetical protein
MTKACDHVIGVYSGGGEFVYASEESDAGALARKEFDEWAKNPRAWPSVVAQGRAKTDRELLEEKCAMFSFCPDCGAPLK